MWDVMVLNGYWLLNLVIGWTVLDAERNGVAPPRWVKPVIYLSIAWAPSIHIVTAYLFAGLPGRGYWLDALMAPGFLASAFASGPALLIIICFVIRRFTRFDPGKEAIQKLATIVTYAAVIHLFFFICKLFTTFYSQVPKALPHFQYLLFGLEGHGKLVPLMWISIISVVVGTIFLIIPRTRRSEGILALACVLVFVGLCIDKGFLLMVGGFIPSALHQITEYWPTVPEALITLGVWAMGLLILTVLYKIAISVKEETRG